MRKYIFTLLFIASFICSFSVNNSKIKFSPVGHASFIIQSDEVTIFVDPVGNIENYKPYPTPQIILITHAHGDHLNKSIIDSIKNDKTIIIGPSIVTNQLGYGHTMANNEKTTHNGILIEAIPMYNLTTERLNFHPKGVGNGYIITLNNERIYISGDTEDIPEMRSLKNIDHAFICMNLPYTMSPEQAASAVLEFKPKNCYPYHYRQKDGQADIEKFRNIVSVNPKINVSFLNWY